MSKTVTIMFHSVGLESFAWVYPYISEPIETFECKIEALRHAGYRSLKMKEVLGGRDRSDRSVCLTFDDGYLDNWVHVFPVLRKYGMKATVFVSPDFVDPRKVVRPRDETGSGSAHEHDPGLCCAGFLSWPEMRRMEQSGVVEIQSHALTRTWYFKGPTVVDFWHPGAATEAGGAVWMLWNRFPDFKPFYLTRAADFELRIPYGTPIYEHGRALITRRYFPRHDELHGRLINSVADHGGVDFFRQPDWRQRLTRIVGDFGKGSPPGSKPGQYETHSEYVQRVRQELAGSKRTIEANLDQTVESLCWPGGGMTEELLAIAREVGYRYFVMPGGWKSAHGQGSYGNMLVRIGSMGRMTWAGRDLGTPTAREFLWYLERHRGSFVDKWLGRAAKLARIIRSYVR